MICTLLVILAITFAAAFVGGYFLGKDVGQTESEHEDQLAQQSTQHRAFSVYYDGSTRILPAFRGSLPVQEFIQPRAVFINGQVESMPGNPLLTPKGTTQIFLYQYGNDVSLIVTATGQNYGEKVENASFIGEGQYRMTVTGLEGDLVQMTDGYHQLNTRVVIPDSLSLTFQWGNVGSRGYIFFLRDPASVEATLYFDVASYMDQPLSIRGCYEYDTEFLELPSPGFPMTITAYDGQFSLQNKPESQSEIPILFSDYSGSNLRLAQINSMSRRRRSMTTHTFPGIAFVVSHPVTNETLHRFELRHEDRHGGKNGTVCWNVQNHVDGVEASFCPLFHKTLYGGHSGTITDGTSRMLVNTHISFMKNNSTFNHVAALVHSFDPDNILESLMDLGSRKRRDSADCLKQLGKDLVSILEHGLKSEWDSFRGKVEATVSAVKKEWDYLVHGRHGGQPLSLKCDPTTGVHDVSACTSSVKKCSGDIASGKFKLDPESACTVEDCGSAVNGCLGIVQDCVKQ